MRAETNITKNWLTVRASGLSDLLDYIETTPRAWSSSCAETYGDESDTGARDLPSALHLARYGWKQGRDKLTSGLKTAAMLRTNAPLPAMSYDVAGAFPDVGLYCSGDPACMVSFDQEQNKTKPIYRFVISLSASAMISGQTIINRGAAILSHVQEIELSGARVEIVGIMSVEVSTGKKFSVGITLKRPEEFLELDRLAFALSSPAMLRRIGFAVYERNAWLESDFSSSYGKPSDCVPDAWQGTQSVYFPALRMATSSDAFDTMPHALQTVAKIIAASLKG